MQDTEKPRVKDNGQYCPLWKQKLSKVCHTCEWYIQMKGKHPQSEEMLDHWGCAIRWMPIVQIETSQMSRQASASSDKVATEVEKLRKITEGENARIVQQVRDASNEYKRLNQRLDENDT